MSRHAIQQPLLSFHAIPLLDEAFDEGSDEDVCTSLCGTLYALSDPDEDDVELQFH